MNKLLILLVEDDAPVRNLMTTTLKAHDYRYLTAANGESAIMEASSHNPDIILLDLGLPDIDGVEVIKKIRTWSNVPIIVISARSEDRDKIDAFDAGADDYLTKPFAMGELLARVRAMLRRRVEYTPEILRCGEVSLDPGSCELIGCGRSIPLSRMEYLLMELLMMNQGTYLSAEVILSKVWGYDSDAEPGNVWVYISYLRKKLTELGCGVGIKVKRGIGYTLEVLS